MTLILIYYFIISYSQLKFKRLPLQFQLKVLFVLKNIVMVLRKVLKCIKFNFGISVYTLLYIMWFTVIKMDRTPAGTGKQDSGHILKNFPGLSSAAGCCLPLNPWVLSNFWPLWWALTSPLTNPKEPQSFLGKYSQPYLWLSWCGNHVRRCALKGVAVIDAKPPKPHGGFTL